MQVHLSNHKVVGHVVMAFQVLPAPPGVILVGIPNSENSLPTEGEAHWITVESISSIRLLQVNHSTKWPETATPISMAKYTDHSIKEQWMMVLWVFILVDLIFLIWKSKRLTGSSWLIPMGDGPLGPSVGGQHGVLHKFTWMRTWWNPILWHCWIASGAARVQSAIWLRCFQVCTFHHRPHWVLIQQERVVFIRTL